MRLPVTIIQRRNNFINLPKVAIKAMYGNNPPTGAVAFKLTWQLQIDSDSNSDSDSDPSSTSKDIEKNSTDPSKKFAYVAWRGGYSTQAKVEIPQAMAECMGLGSIVTQSQTSNVHMFVQVTKTTCSRVTRVNLDPVNENDWEMLELHANQLEDSMLDQVCILYSGQVFPISVGTSGLIRLQVGNVEFSDGALCGILGRDSELIIAPRVRKKKQKSQPKSQPKTKEKATTKDKEIDAVASSSPSLPSSSVCVGPHLQLRLQPMSTQAKHFSVIDSSAVWVHPKTLCWSEMVTNHDGITYAYISRDKTIGPPLASGSTTKNNTTNTNDKKDTQTEQTEQTEQTDTLGETMYQEATLVRVRMSTSIAPGHIALSYNHLLSLQVAPLLSDVFLFPCASSPTIATTDSDVLRIVLYPKNEPNEPNETNIELEEKDVEQAFWNAIESSSDDHGFIVGHTTTLIELTVAVNSKYSKNGKYGNATEARNTSTYRTNVYEVHLLRRHTTTIKASDVVAENVWNEYEAKRDGRAARNAKRERIENEAKRKAGEEEENLVQEEERPWWILLKSGNISSSSSSSNNDKRREDDEDNEDMYMLMTPTKTNRNGKPPSSYFRPLVTIGKTKINHLPTKPPTTWSELQQLPRNQPTQQTQNILQQLQKNSRFLLNPTPNVPRTHVGGVDSVLKKIWSYLASRVCSPTVQARLQTSSPPCGHVYLTGGNGQGKTTVASVIATMFRRYTFSLTHVVWVDCRALLGSSTEYIESILKMAWQEASERSPSVIVLDDLDVLVPSDVDGLGSNVAAARFAEILVDLSWKHRGRSKARRAWSQDQKKSANENTNEMQETKESKKNDLLPSHLLDRWSAPNSHGIGVIATGVRTGNVFKNRKV